MVTKSETVRTMLIASVAALLGIGAMMVYSTTARGDGPLLSGTFLKQVFYMAFAVACALAVGRLDYREVLARHRTILLVSLALLILVLVPGIGHRVKGASRWLRFGPVGFQPSEFAKLALVIFLAAFLSERIDRITAFWSTFVPATGVTGAVCLLVLLEPDIGTCALIAFIGAVVLFIAGARLRYFLTPALVACPLMAFVVSRGYARDRIAAWIDPWTDPSDAGYHIIQSLIAVGSGGVTGVGLGASHQKLFFLPEPQTDFIFAILAEETGLVGVTLVLVLYLVFALCGIYVALRARDLAGTLLAAGITATVSIQAIINIAVVTKVFPTKGIALPFISTGGSSIVVTLISVAILYSIARTCTEPGPSATVQ